MHSNLVVFFVLLQVLNSSCSLMKIDLHLLSTHYSKYGLGWPNYLMIAEGQEALLKLVRPLTNLESCTITAPDGTSFDVNSPASGRYSSWGDGDNCGVRVRNIVMADEGRWRLTARRGNDTLMGFSTVHVQDLDLDYTSTPIHLSDGDRSVNVNLSMFDNSYCLVSKPFAEAALVAGQCEVTVGQATRAVQGTWDVVFGVPGRVQEYTVHRNVHVDSERLDVGYIQDTQTNKLHLYCNVLNTHRNVSFCRFHRTTSASGFNVIDGLSDGSHSYYGEGFVEKQCGITIETPTEEDYSSWRCSVGMQHLVGTVNVQHTPMQALINVARNTNALLTKVRDGSRQSDDPPRTIFVQNDQEVTLKCEVPASLTYCWLQGPDGMHYSPPELSDVEQAYWYSGNSLSVGDCSITFAHALDTFSGLWTCHMGQSEGPGVELTETFELRVTGALAARSIEVEARIGDTVTLYCHSVTDFRPLSYCRFLSPTSIGINVDETVTADQAILGQYYFTANRNLHHGDCSLEIASLDADDVGMWTCAALVAGEPAESHDFIDVKVSAEYFPVSGRQPLSRAGIAGMAVGLSVLVLVLAGYAWHRYGMPLTFVGFRRHTDATSTRDVLDMTSISATSDGSSVDSMRR